MHIKRRADAKRTQSMDGGMAKSEQAAHAGMGGEFLGAFPNRVEIAPSYAFIRLGEIPLVLMVEVAEKVVRTE